MWNEADIKKENHECVTTINNYNYDTEADSETIQILINQFVILIYISRDAITTLFSGCITLIYDMRGLIIPNEHRQWYSFCESFNAATNDFLVQPASGWERADCTGPMSSEGCIAVTDVILELLRVANERAALLPLSSVGMMSEGSSEGCIQLRVVLLWPMWVLPCYLGHPRAALPRIWHLNQRSTCAKPKLCYKNFGRGQDCVNNTININVEDMEWSSHKTFREVYWC